MNGQSSQDDNAINIANYIVGTHTLGPGFRSVVWVQGCPFRCSGCYSPGYISNTPAMVIPVGELSRALLANPQIDGITISGGEPMLQAKALSTLIHKIKIEKPETNFILFSGFRKEWIDRLPGDDPRRTLLKKVDVLIDGTYVADLNDNKGLRGSSNQTIWHLTERLAGYDFENGPRKSDIFIQNGKITFAGVPNGQILQATQNLERFYVRT